MKLTLGILDIPYGLARSAGRARAGKSIRGGGASTQSTGDVAEILEAKYQIMERFYHAHEEEITDAIAQDMSDFFETNISGFARGNAINFTATESTIRTMFNRFIDSQEMDRLGVPGVPTKASLQGVNHRLKHPTAKGNPVRPSFRDTGTYLQSFKATVEET